MARREVLFRAALGVLSVALCLVVLIAFELFVRFGVYRNGWVEVSSRRGLIYEFLPDAHLGINDERFRGPIRASEEAGACRLLVAGDSTTMGLNVQNWRLLWPYWFEKHANERTGDVPKIEVVNLAVSGYNLGQISPWLEHFEARLSHHAVVYGYYDNDRWLGNMNYEMRDGSVLDLCPRHEGELWSPPLIPAAVDELLSRTSRGYLFLRSRSCRERSSRVFHSLSPEQLEAHLATTFYRLLDGWHERVTKRGKAFVVVNVPGIPFAYPERQAECDRGEFANMRDPNYCRDVLARLERLKTWASERRVPFVDLTKGFERVKGVELRFANTPEDWHHVNDAGHRAFGDEFLSAWQAQGLDRVCR